MPYVPVSSLASLLFIIIVTSDSFDYQSDNEWLNLGFAVLFVMAFFDIVRGFLWLYIILGSKL